MAWKPIIKKQKQNLLLIIKSLEAILSDEEKLKHVMKEELRKIKREYATERKTEIQDEVVEIKIDTTSMIPKEDCIVVTTRDGYLKRVSPRSYSSAEGDTGLKDGDYVSGLYKLNTLDTLLLFTDNGNYLFIPVHEIPELKWKDLGKHVSNIIEISPEESVVTAIPAYDFQTEKNVVIVTKNGMVKRSKLKEFKLQRYSKATSCMNLKDDDQVIAAFIEDKPNLFLVTDSGYGLAFPAEEVPIVGVKAAGVKGMKLKDDYLVSANIFDFNQDEYITVITDKGTAKRVRLNEFELLSRARRGLQIVREVKTNPYKVLKTFVVDNKEFIGIKNGDIKTMKLTELPIADRYSTGSLISKHPLTDSFIVANLTKATKEEAVLIKVEDVGILDEQPAPKKERVSLKEIDDRLMTIDDFLN